MVLDRLKRMLGKEEEIGPEFIEIDVGQDKEDSKVIVKTFVLKQYEDVNEILNALREGYTIAVVDIRPLKQKDVVELKRVISKIKKTVEALDGSIAGFGENTVIATPSFVRIKKGESMPEKSKSSSLERF